MITKRHSAVASHVESLEGRCLLSAFVAHVNFQPASVQVPTGYVADTGLVFADRGNGLSYGWNGPKPARVAEHHARPPFDGADPRYDTFATLQPRQRGSLWQIAVPNGNYQIHLVAGDSRAFPARYRIRADGVLVLDGKATRLSRWVDSTTQISVSNGLLTLTTPRGSVAKIDFIDISQIVPGGGNAGSSGTTAPPGNTGTPPPTTSPPPSAWTQPLMWQTLHRAPEPLAEAESIGVNGKLYMFGGYNVTTPDYQPTAHAQVFDPATNTWSRLADMPQAETHIAVASDGQFIYLAGGYTFDPVTTYQTFGTVNVWRYDISHNSWSAFTPLPAARAAGAMVLLGRQLHFFDGVDPSRNGQTNHWVLNLDDANPQWAASTSLPFSRNHVTAAVLDGKIYAIGGQPTDDDSSTSSDVLVWDPANPGAWTAVASLPGPRSHAVTGVIDGRIIVAGGTVSSDKAIDSVIVYDPATNTWTIQTSLPSARLAPAGGIVGNQFIVTTGYFQNELTGTTWATTIQG
jgi:N-acetylneuraminic acid mutarotase